MLEKIKGYIRENRKDWVILLIYLIIYSIFHDLGNIDNLSVISEKWGDLEIFFSWPLIFLFYFINILIVLSYKRSCNKKWIIFNILKIMFSIVVLETIQQSLLLEYWEKSLLSNTFINLLIILVPYILMVSIQSESIREKTKELKRVLLSLLITIIIYMLVDIEDAILAVSLYNII